MATELADIIATRTEEEYEELVNAEHDSNGVARRSWLSVVNVGLSLTKIVIYLLTELRLIVAVLANAMFLDYASGRGLTLKARSDYQIERQAAVSTIGRMLLTMSAGGSAWNVVAGQVIVGQPGASGQIYLNTGAGTLNPGGTLLLEFIAQVAGADGNLPVGATLELKTSRAGVSVTNPVYADATWITTQGQDEESDARLLIRCSTRWATIGVGGNDEAMEFWALAIPTGYAASPVARVKVFSNRLAGVAAGGAGTILIAGSAGALPGADVDAVTANYEGATEDYPGATYKKYAMGTAISVETTTNNSVVLVGTIYINRASGYTDAEVATYVEEALSGYQETLDIGETLYRQRIGAVMAQALPIGVIRNVVLTTPASDTAIAQAYDETAVFDVTGLVYTLVD